MTRTIGALFVAAMLNLGAASAQSVLLNPTTSQAVTQPASTTLSTTSLNDVAYVNPASSVDVVTQINTLSSNCSSTCVIHVPAGTYTTTATTTPITLQPGQSLIGDGQSNTTITGNPTKLIVWHSTGGFPSTGGQISDLTLICGSSTTECIDTGDLIYAKLENLSVYGATTGDCISLQNSHSWFERSQFHNVTVGWPGTSSNLCNVGIHAKAPVSPGTNSFGYFDWGTIYQNSANTGIVIDAGANVYNGTRFEAQDNIGSGDAVRVAGVLTATFISVQGEGSGYGIHTTGIGHVEGCGTSTLNILADNIGNNPDSYMAIDLLQCTESNSIALTNYNGGGATTFTPKIYQGNPQVDAGFGFMKTSTGLSAPVLWYDNTYSLTMGTMAQYSNFGSIVPTWSISQQGDVQQNGSLTVGKGAGCGPAPGAQTGNNEVWEVICGQNTPTLSFQSQISNSGAKTWGFYNVRTSTGDSEFYFGTQSDAYAPTAPAWACTQSAGTPTGCAFVPPTTFLAAITGTTATVNQVISGGSAPTIAAGSGAGTSPTISVTGKNMAGVISLTTGTSPTSMGTVATITFNGALSTAPQGCELMARNVNSAAFFAYIYTTAPSTTSWVINSNGALAGSTAYSWSYICI